MIPVSQATRPISVRLPLNTVTQLDALCAASQKSRGQIVNDLIIGRAAKTRTPIAAMAALCSIRASIANNGHLEPAVLDRLDELIGQLAPRVLQIIEGESAPE